MFVQESFMSGMEASVLAANARVIDDVEELRKMALMLIDMIQENERYIAYLQEVRRIDEAVDQAFTKALEEIGDDSVSGYAKATVTVARALAISKRDLKRASKQYAAGGKAVIDDVG